MPIKNGPGKITYLNGRYLLFNRTAISPMDHGFLYGDAVFESIRIYRGFPFRLPDHLDRLESSAREISMNFPFSRKTVSAIIYNLILKNRLSDGLIRLTVTRGEGPLGLDPSLCARPTLLGLAFPLSPIPPALFQKGISLRLVSVIRNSARAIPPAAKSANFLNNILARIEAKKNGAGEAILLNDKGFVTEGTVSNLFIVRKGKLLTPSPEAGILVGVTRNVVLELAGKKGIRAEEKLFKKEALFTANECFVTSSGFEIMPATRINGKKIGTGKPGPVTVALLALFKKDTARLIS